METKGSATVFYVTDLERSAHFYIDTLGFTEQFHYGTWYAGVAYGEVQIHLSTNIDRQPAGKGQVYVFCDDVDGYHAQIVARGAQPLAEPKDYGYGMYDFDVADPNGNLLAFGMEVKPTA